MLFELLLYKLWPVLQFHNSRALSEISDAEGDTAIVDDLPLIVKRKSNLKRLRRGGPVLSDEEVEPREPIVLLTSLKGTKGFLHESETTELDDDYRTLSLKKKRQNNTRKNSLQNPVMLQVMKPWNLCHQKNMQRQIKKTRHSNVDSNLQDVPLAQVTTEELGDDISPKKSRSGRIIKNRKF